MGVTRYKSEGVLGYTVEPIVGHKLSLAVERGIVDTYRALVPKSVRLQRTRFPPHISVVRKEPIPNLDLWARYEGEDVPFEYEPIIYYDETYYWLRCFSPRLIEIRRELGLEDLSYLARPPDLFDSFHCTIGNLKKV